MYLNFGYIIKLDLPVYDKVFLLDSNFRMDIERSKEVESQLEESIKGHAALEERHKELARANEDMAIEVKVWPP